MLDRKTRSCPKRIKKKSSVSTESHCLLTKLQAARAASIERFVDRVLLNAKTNLAAGSVWV